MIFLDKREEVLHHWTEHGVYPTVRDPETILRLIIDSKAINFYLDRLEEPPSQPILNVLDDLSRNVQLDQDIRSRATLLLYRYTKSDGQAVVELLLHGDQNAYVTLAANEGTHHAMLLDMARQRQRLHRDELLALTIHPVPRTSEFLRAYTLEADNADAAQALSLIDDLPDEVKTIARQASRPVVRMLFASAPARRGDDAAVDVLRAAIDSPAPSSLWLIRLLEAYALSGNRDLVPTVRKIFDVARNENEAIPAGLPRSTLLFHAIRALLLLGNSDDEVFEAIESMANDERDQLITLAYHLGLKELLLARGRDVSTTEVQHRDEATQWRYVPSEVLPANARRSVIGIEELAIIRANWRRGKDEGRDN